MSNFISREDDIWVDAPSHEHVPDTAPNGDDKPDNDDDEVFEENDDDEDSDVDESEDDEETL